MGDRIIWRYMTLESFMSLISNKSLSFCRYDKLKSIDPYECSKSSYEIEQLDFHMQLMRKLGKGIGNPLLGDCNIIESFEEEIDKTYFINCWHVNDYESIAMWDSFTSSKTGIAIKTSLNKLKLAIETDKYDLKFEDVKYVDLRSSKETIDKVIRKTKYFEHEKELRVYFKHEENRINQNTKHEINGELCFGIETKIDNPERISVEVNLNNLIDEVVVSPKAETWFEKLIKNILNDYGIQKTVKESDVKIKNIEINSPYELINMEDEIKNFIENSSEGTNAKEAKYRMAYDKDTGEIKGCYPTNFNYKEVPEPYVVTDWQTWKKWCSDNQSVRVNIQTCDLVIK